VLEPVSSDNLQTVDLDRLHEVERRHALVSEYLTLRNLDAVLLLRPENFAWMTCGGDNTGRSGSERAAALFITPEARLVLCSAVDSGQLFDCELNGLGFQLKERPWTEDRAVLMRDLCRGRTVAIDTSPADGLNDDLADFRIVMSAREHDSLRSLGIDLAHCIEAAARHCEQGNTEAEVAGHVAHRLIRREIVPTSIQVMADGQGRRYRHWAFSDERIERFAVITAIGRRQGLHLGVSRTVCFNSPPQELLESHQHASLVQATGMYFSSTDWTYADTWSRVARIYEKFGAPDEWRSAEQAEVIGYDRCESAVIPDSARKFVAGSAIYWHPSVRSAMSGDSILLHPDGVEVLTVGDNWPMLPVMVKGLPLPRPAILFREPGHSTWSGLP
jgi:hypothetical protein